MEWSIETVEGATIGCPQGRVDEESWELFLARMNETILAAAAAGHRFVLDLARLDYMSSRGLRALTIAKREADVHGVPMALARPNDRLREILAISRYDKIFPVTASRDVAD
ncbi:anti-sigma B factor antagonist/stage II sporulation protein AA (anti-sigma F factor antagonist) [Sphingomonas laterariae]|uniref:Anti-sigma B factor antagonist/stage II sporulation protein AA (Anti-sigma F factor antagonist) n=1 Tax=Edaphosphingomonas laterariae TaxID=861865 RepID=A0A239E0N2_9SPHN|nr:STAS domain-containing protein [Sphingomonas laterariae]SNS38157.1 anti-sigma B factor antagonist/stage II sporulation protein AA (anti-sigma F factor antagonist) [Sphingomonas laterariae]